MERIAAGYHVPPWLVALARSLFYIVVPAVFSAVTYWLNGDQLPVWLVPFVPVLMMAMRIFEGMYDQQTKPLQNQPHVPLLTSAVITPAAGERPTATPEPVAIKPDPAQPATPLVVRPASPAEAGPILDANAEPLVAPTPAVPSVPVKRSHKAKPKPPTA